MPHERLVEPLSLLGGLLLGAGAAASGSVGWYRVATALEPVGTLWTNAIRMTVIPLVVALLVTGVAATADPKRLGRVGARAMPVFFALLLAKTTVNVTSHLATAAIVGRSEAPGRSL